MSMSKIEWTENTWNPVTGCTKISAGCLNCYAERMALRLKSMGAEKYKNGFDVQCHNDSLSLPLTWKKRKMVFVNSMSDLFHEAVPASFIKAVFSTMNLAQQHTFQVLTKRSDRLAALSEQLNWSENIWMGVTIEDDTCLGRIDALNACGAAVKFLSCEPLLGALGCPDLSGVDWVIVGGESGPSARPMDKEWAVQIREQCKKMGIPFFFKQWGGVNKKKAGRLLEGKIWDQMPYRKKARRVISDKRKKLASV